MTKPTSRDLTEMELTLHFAGGQLGDSCLTHGISVAHVVMENVRTGRAAKVDRHGDPCSACNGSGIYRKRGSWILGKWVPNDAWAAISKTSPNYDPEHEPGPCVRCHGTGVGVSYTAKPSTESRSGGPPAFTEPSTSTTAQALMRCSDRTNSVLAVAFGEAPGWFRGERRYVLLWPWMQVGVELGGASAGRLRRLMQLDSDPNPITQAKLRLMRVHSIALLESAISEFEEKRRD